MKTFRSFWGSTVVAWALLLLIGFTQTACVYYQRYPLPKSRMKKVDLEQMDFYLLDAAHPTKRCWYVSERIMRDTFMDCFVARLTEDEAEQVFTIRSRRDASTSRNEVLFFLKPRMAMGLADTATIRLGYSHLQKVEVYEPNHARSILNSVIGVSSFFLGLGLFGVLVGDGF